MEKEKKEKKEKKVKIKKKKKLSVKKIILIVVVAFIAFSFIKSKLFPKKDDQKKIEVVEVTKRNIAKSISDTGVVKTATAKDFTSPLTGSKILTVDVKEGDQIKPGDVICTFDTSDIQRNLDTAIKTAGISDAQAKIGINGAARNYNDAISNRDSQSNSTQTDVNSAKKAFDDSTDALNKLRASVQALEPQVNEAKANLPALQKAYTDAKDAYEFAQKNVFVAPSQAADPNAAAQGADANAGEQATGISGQELADLYSKYKTAEEAFNGANSIISQYDSLVAQKTEMEKSSSQLLAAYEKAVQGAGTTSRTSDSTVASSYDALLNSELQRQSSSVTAQSQIAQLRKQLKDGKLVSDVSGTITKVNFKPGDLYSGSTIAVLDGCEDIVIEANIGEYDIPDVKEGMRVMIKTDATREEELEGRITYVSPVSSSMISSTPTGTGTISTSTAASFPVKISLNEGNDRLRLGMNAKLSIITEMKNNVLSVPSECVITKDDGSCYIEVADNDEGTEKHELAVQKGIEGSLYVEIISDELKEGMKVVVPEVEASNSLESLLGSMRANGGI